jgi:hypothetical protein
MMTSQEQQLIEEFLQRLAAVHGVAKDREVDALINQRLAGQPDALYLLVQRSLLLERALNDAKQQIAQLQQAAPRGDAGGASFLNPGIEPGFGRAPSTPGLYPTQPATPQQMETPMRQAAPGWRERLFGSPAAPAPMAPVAQPSSGPSFLGTAASAAAGVAGGMFLYNGIQGMMHGNHANNGNSNGLFDMGNPSTSSLSQQPAVVENITQNYYGSDETGGRNVDTSGDFLRDDGNGWTDASAGGSDFFDDDNIV